MENEQVTIHEISRRLQIIKRLANDDQVDDETIMDEIEEVRDLINSMPKEKDRQAAERLFNKVVK